MGGAMHTLSNRSLQHSISGKSERQKCRITLDKTLKMLSVKDAKEILDRYNYTLNDDEITELINFLSMIALSIITEEKYNTDEEGNNIL